MQQRKCKLSFIPNTDIAFVNGFVMKSSQFKSDIKICCGDSIVNAKSILGVIHAAIVPADEFILQADGIDENEALEVLSAYLADSPERSS